MLDPARVESVRRLLAQGRWSLRKIARMTGISRGTVGAIAHGKRRDRPPSPLEGDDLLVQPAGPLCRCPGCGGLVQMPCRLCRVRAWKASPRSKPLRRRPEGPLQLDLSDEHRLRYEAVRKHKQTSEVFKTSEVS